MIVPMKRLSLAAMQADEERLLEALQKIGTVEIIGILEDPTEAERSENALSRLQKLNDSMEAIKPFAPKKSFFTPQKREISLAEIRHETERAATVADSIESLLHEKSALSGEREKLLAQKEDLLPWINLNAPMDSIRNTKRVSYFVGFCAQKDLGKLDEQEFLEAQFVSDGTDLATIIACRSEDSRVAQNFLKSIEWTDYAFPKSSDTPCDAIRKIDERLAQIQTEVEKIENNVMVYSEQLELLENAADLTVIDLDRMEAKHELTHTNTAFLLEGWVREDCVEQTEDAVRSVTQAYSFEVR